MIVVVADTSPLNYLSQINCDHVLPALYERVFVPAAVVEEPDDPKPVAAVRARLTRLPSWVVSVRNRQTDMLSSNGWMQHSCSSYGIAGSVSGKMASGPRKTGGAHVEYVAYAAKRYPPCTAENYLADRAMLRVVQMQLAKAVSINKLYIQAPSRYPHCCDERECAEAEGGAFVAASGRARASVICSQ